MSNTMQHAVKRRQLEILAGIDPSHSHFVTGFFTKCAQSGRTPIEALREASMACDVHPAIAREFAKCGFDAATAPFLKFAETPGIQSVIPGGAKPPAISALAKPAAAPAASPVAPPTPPPAAPIKYPPNPSLNSGMTPAHQESWYSAPFNTVRELFNGSPTAQHAAGFRRLDPSTGQSTVTLPKQEASTGSLIGAAGRTAAAGLGAAPALGIDALRAIGGNTNMDYSKMMGRSIMDLPNTAMGTDIGHNVAARPSGDFGDSYIGPDEGRGFFGSTKNPITGAETPGALQAAGKYNLDQSQLPDAEGGSAISRIGHSVTGNTLNFSDGMVPMLAGAKGFAPKTIATATSSLTSPMTAGFMGLPQILDETVSDSAGHQQTLVNNTQNRRAMDAEVQALDNPPMNPGLGQSPIEQPAPAPTTDPTAAPGEAKVPAQPTDPQPGEAQPSVPTPLDDFFGKAKEFAQQMPEQAGKMMSEMQTKMTGIVQGAGKQFADMIAKTGEVPPEVEQGSIQPLVEKMGLEGATAAHAAMDPWQKYALWGGIGVAGLGLVNAMTGNGGIGSWIMSLLGAGAAGLAAAHGGMFGEGAKGTAEGVVQGGKDLVAGVQGGMNSEPIADWKQKALQMVISDTTGIGQAALGRYADANPDVAKQLDQAAGTGSWGNSALSFIGDISGQKDRIMQERLGLTPEQNQQLLQMWKRYRDSQVR